MQITPGTFIYMHNYYSIRNVGEYFTIESFDGKKLKSKLVAQHIDYDTTNGHWKIRDYLLREFVDKDKMVITKGTEIDTVLNMRPSDFKAERKYYETMNNWELRQYIDEQMERGLGNVEEFEIELQRRIASPFSAIILTLIGVSLASRKVRGGMGLHIGIGIALSFTYILFMTISTTFAVNGNMSPWLAVWIPNFVFAIIGVFLYVRAPK
jgi:lipopolysaccharide export system permease protein